VGHFVVVGLDRRRIACYIFVTPSGTGFIRVMPFPEIVWHYFKDSVFFIKAFHQSSSIIKRITKVWICELFAF